MKKIFCLSYLLLSIALTSCSNFPVAKQQSENVFEAGTKFNIILEENHRDGATWQVTDDYDSKVVKIVNAVWHGPDKGLYYTMQAAASGETRVNFIKRKYTDTLERRQFMIRVITD